MMDHGRFAPFALAGGRTGAMTEIEVGQGGTVTRPAHVSKGAGYEMKEGDWIEVRTPGGGGWGDPHARDRALVARDVARGYLTAEQAMEAYGYSPSTTPRTVV
jgi:N-methylhydantoinase B